MSRVEQQKGSIIIFAVSVLALVVSIAVGIAPIFIAKYRTSQEASRSTVATYVADSGIEWCLYVNRDNPNPPAKPIFINGATIEVYNPSNNPAACTTAENPLNHRSVGTYQGVSRSFYIAYPDTSGGLPTPTPWPTPTPIPTPIINIDCETCAIAYHDSTIITWSSSNTTSCSVAPAGWTGLSGCLLYTSPSPRD